MNEHLRRWQTHLYAEGKAKRTIQDRITTMQRFEGDRGSLLEATSDDIAIWLGRPELGPLARSCYHSMLKAFYRWAVLQGLRADDPTTTIRAAKRPKREPRPITWGQFQRLVDTAPNTSLRAMLILAGYAGLRVHEIAKFRGRDLDCEGETLTVVGKGGGSYVLPAHPEIIAIAKHMPVVGYWFPSQRAEHLGGREVTQRIRLHMIRQHVPAVPHQLRHFYGTELVRSGADLRVVQTLMRHANLATTAVYTDVCDDRKRDAIMRLQMPVAAST